MKPSVSLSADHVALGDDYAAAWDEWETNGEGSTWDVAVGDGLADAPR